MARVVIRRYNDWRELPDAEAREEAQTVLTLLGGWSPAWEEVFMPPREVATETNINIDCSREFWLDYAGWNLVRRIQQQGLQTPLVMARGHLEGNHRLAAALYLNLPVVPVYRAVSS